MKNLLGLFAILAVVTSTAAFSVAPDAEPATIVRAGGCFLFDVEDAEWIDPGCRVQSVETKNGYVYDVHGRLPDGAMLPERTLRRKVSDLPGIVGCFEPGDRGDMVIAPSGRVNITCRPAR